MTTTDPHHQPGGTPLDLAGPEANNDPDGFSRRALADGAIQWSDLHRGWLLLGHREVTDGFRDHRLSADRITSLERLASERPAHFGLTVELLSGWMIFATRRSTPASGTRYGGPSPRTVDRLRERIETTVTELLDEIEPGTDWDFKERIASPLPAFIIADLLGVPPSERYRFQAWSDDLAQIVFSVEPGSLQVDDLRDATEQFTTFFGELLEHRRRHPGDDLISAMANDTSDELSAMELVGACTLLLFAGHETTTNLLTSSIRLFNDHPDLRHQLLDDPSLATTAADELLRVVGPAKSMVRRVKVDHQRGPHHFEVGQRVYLVILTANRDPSVYDRPEVVDLGRNPNPQLGFGWGLHHCLGAPLARLEASITLRQLYQRFPALTLADPDRSWSGNALGRGFGRMPVRS